MKSPILYWLTLLGLTLNLKAYDSVVVFNEIQYHPADDTGSEFVELYNQNTVDVDLSGWRISGGVDFAFPEGTVIQGQSYLVVAASPASLESAAGITGVLGPLVGSLANKGETIRLRNLNDRIMDEIDYNDRAPWPVTPDGSGSTLAKTKAGTTGRLPKNWQASPGNGGTPGAENFPGLSDEPETMTSPLIQLDATWHYSESGADLGPTWASTSHPVGGNWKSGKGMLAYETPAAAEFLTNLTRPATNDPYVVTYYFETEFEITQEQYDSLHAITVTHRVDDGAVFYLNGTEVLRDNMDSGLITASTTAASNGDFTIEGPLQIPTGSLQVGTNRVSVEVHQGSVGSSDIVFGLEADLMTLLPDSSGFTDLRLSELAPAGGQDWWVEITNLGRSPTDLAGCVLATSGEPMMELTLPAGVIDPGGYITINAGSMGFSPPSTDRLFLYGPGKTTVIDGADLKATLQARNFSVKTMEFFGPSTATPGAANVFDVHDEIVINEIMYHHRPQYAQEGEPPAIQPVEIFGYSQSWRYHESGGDLGSNWANTSHPIGGDWLGGPGPLGWENPAPLPFGTVISRPAFNSPFVTTHYFETDFNLTADELVEISQLQINHLIDDGAVFYLNGQEIGRFNLPEGAINAATLSMDGVEASEVSFTFQPDALVEGTNRISVEVHQQSVGSSDIVMGLKLASLREIPSPNPPVDFVENPEEWIELYNRSSAPVDLSNWKFDRGIEFEFPVGTQLAANSYLVVARDASALSSEFTGITILGDYNGSLSNNGELVRLSDSKGHPADEVFYYDGNPWPTHSDGGGCSLELRHPNADNVASAAWAASDESGESDWKTYSVTMTAADPRYRPSQNNFHELRLGLLDGGELLLDDVSVLEDPNGLDGPPRELIQNGSFDSGANGWRLLGTHEESQVINEGGNAVLKVVATSRMNYMNNLLETSCKSGGAIVTIRPGTEYKISFRAKWLQGSPQFRAELYYNKLAKNFILDQPNRSGTPGTINSTFLGNPGPTFTEVTHDPPVPPVDTPVTVTARVSDFDGVAEVRLFYSVSGGAFQSAPMGETSKPGYWSGQLPGQSRGTKTQFYLEATDAAETPAKSAFPAAGPDSRAMVQVEDGKASAIRQNLRVIMLNTDSAAMHRANDLLQNRRLGCTVIVNESEIHYDCGIRLRGSMFSRRNSGSTGLNIKFPNDQPFRGIHKTITTGTGTRAEIIAKHIITQAGGLHDGYDDFTQIIHTTQNGVAARLSMARFGSSYLDGLPDGDGSEGTVFKMEGIRVFQATDNGTPEGQKLPFPIGWVPLFDLADQGDDKEIYRHNTRINTNLDKDDYTDIIAMSKALSLSGSELETAFAETANVDMWMRQFALLSLLGVNDTYTQGNPHNLNMYARPSDGRIEPMPWDWDHLFDFPTNSSLWGNRNLAKVITRPANTRLFYGHLHNLINTAYNADYMAPWLSHYSSIGGGSFTGNANYIRNRSSYVLGRLPTAIPFAISTNGGTDFSVEIPSVTLSGTAWINVRKIRLNDSPEAIVPSWLDEQTWTINVPVQPGVNPLTLTALSYEGDDLHTDTITVTNSGVVAPATSGNLVISEIMYHPAGGTPHEFLELLNIHPSSHIDLTGVRFVDGVDFNFPDGFTLAPGERVLVVNDLAAFTSKYGNEHLIAGIFANQSKLNNGGEEIALIDATGKDIARFTYSDSEPWPTSADGSGKSLVLLNPEGNPDLNLSENWRASNSPDGSPGRADPISKFSGDATADTDRDGYTDLFEYALASDPQDSNSRPTFEIRRDSSGVNLSIEVLATADDVRITPELSGDLVNWTPGGAELTVAPGLGGVQIHTFHFDLPPGEQRAFLRVQIQLQ